MFGKFERKYSLKVKEKYFKFLSHEIKLIKSQR